MKTFRKYKNRKLYSPDAHKYVTLVDILDHVKQGQEVQVIAHGSSRDVTSEVIREAILRSSELSTDKLVDLVRQCGQQ